MDYASQFGGGQGGGGAGDKATASASSSTSGNQFGGIGGDGGGVNPLALVIGAGVFVLGLVVLVWAIGRGH